MPNRQHEQKQTSGKQNANPPAQKHAHESAQRQDSHMHADNARSTQNNQRNQGEGNRTADREIRNNPNNAAEFASAEQVEERAADAREASEGDEGVTLEKSRKQAPRGHEKN